MVRIGTGALLATLVWVTSAAAQGGTIRGNVTDSSGAAVANSTVTV